MWARHCEVMLGLWLAISGFLFAVPADETLVWTVELAGAAGIVLFSLVTYARPLHRAHLVTLLIGLGVFVFGFIQPRPLPPWHQNHVLVGLLLSMFAILPSWASRPPRGWVEESA